MEKSIDRMKEGRWTRKEKGKMRETGWTNCRNVVGKKIGKENEKGKEHGMKQRAISSGNILK